MMSSETFHCHLCGQNLPLINKTIHELRCRGPRPAPQSSGVVPTPPKDDSKDRSASFNDNSVIHVDSDDNYESPPSTNHNGADRWSCQVCTFKGNSIVDATCEVCGSVDENMAAIAATIAEENMHLDDDDVQYIPPDITDGKSTGGSGSTSNSGWTCSHCTMINASTHQECGACGGVRPGQSSYRDRLINDQDYYTYEGMEGEEDMLQQHHYYPMSNNNNDRSSSSSSRHYDNPLESAYGGAVFGAGLGAALAFLNEGDLAEGALTGAGVGALGGMMLNELNRNSNSSSGRNNNRYGSSSGQRNSSSNAPSNRQTNMLFDDSDDFMDESLLMRQRRSRSEGGILERHTQMMDQMMMMDPAMMALLLNRGGAGGGGGGGGLIGGDDIDRMTYEQLSERFQQPVRRVDEGTIGSLPSRIIRDTEGGNNGRRGNNSSSSGASGASVREAIDLTSSSPPSKMRRMPSSTSSSSGSGGATAASPKQQQQQQEEREGCAICLAQYSPGEEVKTLPCLHCFHSECIEGWLRVNHTCPVCKYSLLLQRK